MKNCKIELKANLIEEIKIIRDGLTEPLLLVTEDTFDKALSTDWVTIHNKQGNYKGLIISVSKVSIAVFDKKEGTLKAISLSDLVCDKDIFTLHELLTTYK